LAPHTGPQAFRRKTIKAKVVKTRRPRAPKPPDYLSFEAKKFWNALVLEYRIDDAAGLRILTGACVSFDRSEAARAEIEKHGVLVVCSSGGLRANPACAIERDSRAMFHASLKQLNLDLEPLRSGPGRPSGGR
jgi:phage terminase small subunit